MTKYTIEVKINIFTVHLFLGFSLPSVFCCFCFFLHFKNPHQEVRLNNIGNTNWVTIIWKNIQQLALMFFFHSLIGSAVFPSSTENLRYANLYRIHELNVVKCRVDFNRIWRNWMFIYAYSHLFDNLATILTDWTIRVGRELVTLARMNIWLSSHCVVEETLLKNMRTKVAP